MPFSALPSCSASRPGNCIHSPKMDLPLWYHAGAMGNNFTHTTDA